VKKEDMQIK